MKQTLAGLMLLLMAGCATVEEFRAEPPDAVIRLKLPPEQAALCMTRNLERLSSAYRTDRRPGPERGVEMVVTLADGTLFIVADLKAQGGGSDTTIWMGALVFITKKAMIERLTAGC